MRVGNGAPKVWCSDRKVYRSPVSFDRPSTFLRKKYLFSEGLPNKTRRRPEENPGRG
ncbi:hypothetical protein [Sinomicrobium oceani]|uniref:hypothetical protein n=1 Tax=Sinomicrobium oceani TaxID=1150368 RepID=UPI000B174FD0|nr:hypothetical protein [Sinomicrobium oceani]